jgi:hypothetical protein
VKLVKDSKLKVQASIQGEAVRVSGAKRDDLQQAIALVKKTITDFPVQFRQLPRLAAAIAGGLEIRSAGAQACPCLDTLLRLRSCSVCSRLPMRRASRSSAATGRSRK